MKKSLLSALGLSTLMLASCSSEDLQSPASDGPVVFTVSLPGEFTRAISDGETATQLTYAVYVKGETTAVFSSKHDGDPKPSFSDKKATLSLNLAKGKEYDCIFWADKPDNSVYTFSEADKTITISYDGIVSNDEDRDAFFAAETIKVTGAATKTIELRRPFAQLNFATSDLDAAKKAGFEFGGSRVKVSNVYTKLNLLSGKAFDGEEITFAYAPKVVDDNARKVVNGKTYDWLSMNYLLTGVTPADDNVQKAESELVDLVFVAGSSAAADVNTINVSQVPVQRNYRTNIYGNLLTSTVDFNIVIDPIYYEDDYTAEYDGEGFRVSHSLAEAQNLLKAGEPAVSVDAAFLSATRAAADVEFLLNKTVPWQKLKIKGESAVGVKVSYDELAEGATPAENPRFTLVVTNKVPSATIDLPEAAVDIKGSPESGAESAQVGTVTVENAGSATISGDTKVDNIETGDGFTGDVEFDDNIELTVKTAEDFLKAFSDESVKAINVAADLDLTNATLEQLTVNTPKTLNIEEGKTVTLGNKVYFETNADFTIAGKGKLTNHTGNNNDMEKFIDTKTLVMARHGHLTIDGATLENDPDWHWHGKGVNVSAVHYYNDADITVKNQARITSGGFTICGMFTAKGNINLSDSYFESTSSNKYDSHFAYNMRLRGSITLTNIEVKGIQGGVSVETAYSTAVINGGKYYTVNSEGRTDAFYPVYITDAATVIINDGEFCGANNWGGNLTEGTSCIVTGDNDVNKPSGFMQIKGGKFSGKAYNHKTKTQVALPDGYEYVANTGADKDKYPWLVQAKQQ